MTQLAFDTVQRCISNKNSRPRLLRHTAKVLHCVAPIRANRVQGLAQFPIVPLALIDTGIGLPSVTDRKPPIRGRQTS